MRGGGQPPFQFLRAHRPCGSAVAGSRGPSSRAAVVHGHGVLPGCDDSCRQAAGCSPALPAAHRPCDTDDGATKAAGSQRAAGDPRPGARWAAPRGGPRCRGAAARARLLTSDLWPRPLAGWGGFARWYTCDESTCTGADNCVVRGTSCRPPPPRRPAPTNHSPTPAPLQCASASPPGGLDPSDTPQFVLVTHDDAVSSGPPRPAQPKPALDRPPQLPCYCSLNSSLPPPPPRCRPLPPPTPPTRPRPRRSRR